MALLLILKHLEGGQGVSMSICSRWQSSIVLFASSCLIAAGNRCCADFLSFRVPLSGARLRNFHAKASHLWVFGANTLCTACAHTKACRTKLLIKISHSKAWQRGKQTVSWHQNIIKSSSGGFFVVFPFPVSPRIHKPFHQYANWSFISTPCLSANDRFNE